MALDDTRRSRATVISLPNIFSLARLLSVPLLVWLMLTGAYGIAFALFLAAGLTDAIDGFIAKNFNARTELGAYLDPLADKALLVSVYVTLGHLGHLPIWLVILVVFRDVLIVGGAVLMQLLAPRAATIEPMTLSKINTGIQIALAAFVLCRLGIGFDDRGFGDGLAVLTGLSTVVSGLAYLVQLARRPSRVEGGS